jgi:putative FmdB family regulatory protein
MPFYTYECMNCGKLSDLVCSFDDKERLEKDIVCEICGSRHMNQQFRINIMSDGSGGKSCAGDSCNSCNGCN